LFWKMESKSSCSHQILQIYEQARGREQHPANIINPADTL
jgi:hypothetical protein